MTFQVGDLVRLNKPIYDHDTRQEIHIDLAVVVPPPDGYKHDEDARKLGVPDVVWIADLQSPCASRKAFALTDDLTLLQAVPHG